MRVTAESNSLPCVCIFLVFMSVLPLVQTDFYGSHVAARSSGSKIFDCCHQMRISCSTSVESTKEKLLAFHATAGLCIKRKSKLNGYPYSKSTHHKVNFARKHRQCLVRLECSDRMCDLENVNDIIDAMVTNSVESTTIDHKLAEFLDGGEIFESSLFSQAASTPSRAQGPFVYSWKKPKASGIVIDSKREAEFSKNATISQLSAELDNLRAEHRDINDISDRIAARGQYGGSIQYQIASLKKRKLQLKDKIATLEARLESALRDSIQKADEQPLPDPCNVVKDPLGVGLAAMMKRLRELGLRPEPVPPHKDSFFLSLMKGLQRIGLRPNGYDFGEATVMGSDGQFPQAAKRAKYEVLKLLSSQADRLNGIAGWKLSSEEFQRYFSKAWWTLPAARDDLFMASAHLYSVRLVIFSIDANGLDEQVYDPPGGVGRATVYLCRRDAHTIATAPLVRTSSPPPQSAPSPIPPLAPQQAAGYSAEAAAAVPPPRAVPRPPPPPSAVPAGEAKRRGGKRGSGYVSKEDLDAGLGLLDPVVDTADEGDYQADESMTEEIFEDDEVLEDRSSASRRAGSMYGTPARTRRVFVAVTLAPAARAAVGALASALRRDFPLEGRLADSVVRWVDPESYHVTLASLHLGPPEVAATAAAMRLALGSSGQGPFRVRTGQLGSFWRAAGSGSARLPRVIWLGLDGAGAGPLLRLRDAIDQACGGLGESPARADAFCAHITLAKTRPPRGGEATAAGERRVLRALGKWVQDPARPLGLQRLLASQGSGSLEAGGGRVASSRGERRARSWLRQAEAGGLGGKLGPGPAKQQRRAGRDVGALNAELAASFAASFYANSHADAALGSPPSLAEAVRGGGGAGAMGADGQEGRDMVSVEIAVDCLSLIEAVPVAGTGRVRYVTLEQFPQDPEAPPTSPEA